MRKHLNMKIAREAIWIEGSMIHVDASKMCQAMGIPDTEANQEKAGDLARQIIRGKIPGIEIIHMYE